MSDLLALVREDLRGFAGYSSARSEKLQGDVWLNANESAWPNPADATAGTGDEGVPPAHGLPAVAARARLFTYWPRAE